jgi:hypothetical protein
LAPPRRPRSKPQKHWSELQAENSEEGSVEKSNLELFRNLQQQYPEIQLKHIKTSFNSSEPLHSNAVVIVHNTIMFFFYIT